VGFCCALFISSQPQLYRDQNQRQLGVNQANSSKSMERLSSGMRINRAGDDAAGLAISEKMRGQIRGLKQAQRNAQDGISLIQTAEGALNETHAILQRMRELATQSATDTNTEADRAEIQKEIDQLAKEITRIGNTTEFNTQTLLNGSFTDKVFHIGANEGQNVDLAVNDMRAETLKVAFEDVLNEIGDEELGLLEAGKTYTVVSFAAVDVGDPDEDPVLGAKYGLADDEGNIVAVSADGKTYTALDEATAISGLAEAELDGDDIIYEFTVEVQSGTVTVEEVPDEDPDGDSTYSVTANGGINVLSQTNADQAITTINDALETVSAERSKLGAMQNRLEHTIANLGTSAENLQAAESRIRDLDMAEEIMAFTKNNILQQAATAMLAQANMAPQSVLQLLG
jgi:flagellin